MAVLSPLDGAHQAALTASANQADIIMAMQLAGIGFENNNTLGWQASNVAGAQAIIDTPALWLAACKANKQALLDATWPFAQNTTGGQSGIGAFIMAGTITTVTATNVGTFLATITNNYRTLRAAIANATTAAGVAAVNIAAGWPANP